MPQNNHSPNIQALIPAAGTGQRFGSAIPKQYLPLAGKFVLSHAIDSLIASPEVKGITVVLAENDRFFDEVIDQQTRTLMTVIGGATRAGSVLNGLTAIMDKNPETEWVLVHDAARPCLSGESLNRLLEAGLNEPDGAILAVPIQDTLKRANKDGRIENTIDRSGLWAAQTPQLFPVKKIYEALHAMLNAGITPTDEASAIEYMGGHPLLVPGSTENIKITRPEDLATAQAWFSSKNNADLSERS